MKHKSSEDITAVTRISPLIEKEASDEGMFEISDRKKWIRRVGSFIGLLSALAALLEQIPGKVGIVGGLVGGFLNKWLPEILDEKKKIRS